MNPVVSDQPDSCEQETPILAGLAHLTARHRWAVIGSWLALTTFGGFAASQVSQRWLESFSIPGYSAYEASQRMLERFGTGERAPIVLVFQTKEDATSSEAIPAAMERALETSPGARASSFFSTESDAYVSEDRHTTFMELYPAGTPEFDTKSGAEQIRKAALNGLPADIAVHVTGRDPISEASSNGDTSGPSALVEGLIGGLGALIILFFVFGTLPAVLLPIAIAVTSILNTFTLVWILTYITDVSIAVQFLVVLVGLGVAIDYALLMIFRFRDELREGEDVETALVETITHAGRAVIVSGSTVAVGLLSLVVLPLPFIRSMGIGGMLIPAVSVLSAITLLPALLAVLGARINSVRLLPKRLVDRGHPEDGPWARWGRLVNVRPIPVAAVGLAIVGVLVYYGSQLNPNEAQLKNFPGSGDAIVGHEALSASGITPGVLKPFEVLVENGDDPEEVAAKLRGVDGIAAAVAPKDWRNGDAAIVEAFPAIDGAAPGIQGIIDRSTDVLKGTNATVSGIPAVDRDLVHAIYGNFPYLLAFVLALTYILLARAFRSLVLPLKAVILNLVSLAAAFGLVVFVFQLGHGSGAWGIDATQAINPWIPMLIFAFLFGLSMDYEVFMLTRMREAYDATGSTEKAIELGLARTGKLVTSAAFVLMFAFFTLSLSPGYEIKQLAIGLAAGIVLDATVIRVLLVPALMRLLGRANWWMPAWARRPRQPRTPSSRARAAHARLDQQ
jgi:RND superfamily putative drug exporter